MPKIEMKSSSLDAAVRKPARRLLIFAVVGLAITVGVYAANATNISQSINGPKKTSAADLVRGAHDGSLEDTFVDIDGTATVDSGIRIVKKDSSGNKETEEVLSFVLVGGEALVVRTTSATTSTHFRGRLVRPRENLEQQAIDKVVTDQAARAKVLPLVLDSTTDHVEKGVAGAVALALAAALCLAGIVVAVRASLAPRSAKAVRKVRAAHGDAAVASLDEQLGRVHWTCGPLELTDGWLVGTQTAGCRAVVRPWSDLVWAYRKVITRRSYGVKVGTTHQAVFCWADGKSTAFTFNKEEPVQQIQRGVAQAAPAAFAGYSTELDNAWKKRKSEMIAAAAARRIQVGATASTPAPAPMPQAAPVTAPSAGGWGAAAPPPGWGTTTTAPVPPTPAAPPPGGSGPTLPPWSPT